MKGWIVSTENSEGSAIVFANTRNEAKLEALYTDKFSDERYIDLRAHRVPEIDGMENCDIDNLYLLTLGENAMMNKRGYRSENPEITDVGLATVRLERAIKERKKEIKRGRAKT